MGNVTYPVIPLRESIEEAIHLYTSSMGCYNVPAIIASSILTQHLEGHLGRHHYPSQYSLVLQIHGEGDPSLAIPEIAYDTQSSSI